MRCQSRTAVALMEDLGPRPPYAKRAQKTLPALVCRRSSFFPGRRRAESPGFPVQPCRKNAGAPLPRGAPAGATGRRRELPLGKPHKMHCGRYGRSGTWPERPMWHMLWRQVFWDFSKQSQINIWQAPLIYRPSPSASCSALPVAWPRAGGIGERERHGASPVRGNCTAAAGPMVAPFFVAFNGFRRTPMNSKNRKNPLCSRLCGLLRALLKTLLAEREGFEPSIQV